MLLPVCFFMPLNFRLSGALFAAVCDRVRLELQTIRSAHMREIGLDGFAGRILPVESFLDHFFHDGNVPDIPEEAVHLYHVFKRQPDHGQPLFHVVKGAVDLLFDHAADIADTFDITLWLYRIRTYNWKRNKDDIKRNFQQIQRYFDKFFSNI